MSRELSMMSRRKITKKFAREYAKAGKVEKGRLLDELVHATGWTRDHARRAILAANARKGTARQQTRKPRPRKYSYDALVVLQEVWRLAPVRAAVGEASRRGHGRYFGTARPVPGAGQGAIPSESRSAR